MIAIRTLSAAIFGLLAWTGTAVAQGAPVPTPQDLPLPSLVILPTGTAERIAMVRDIQTELNRMGCDAGEVTGYWGPQGDAALARLALVRPDTDGVRLSMSLLSFLELMPPGVCPRARACATWSGGELCEDADEGLLTVALQSELNRIGCDAGPADGSWGRRSDAALARAAEKAPDLKDAARGVSLLASLAALDASHCPVVCRATETLRNGACVQKTCGAGQQLRADGSCGAARKCYNYNGRTYCE